MLPLYICYKYNKNNNVDLANDIYRHTCRHVPPSKCHVATLLRTLHSIKCCAWQNEAYIQKLWKAACPNWHTLSTYNHSDLELSWNFCIFDTLSSLRAHPGKDISLILWGQRWKKWLKHLLIYLLLSSTRTNTQTRTQTCTHINTHTRAHFNCVLMSHTHIGLCVWVYVCT